MKDEWFVSSVPDTNARVVLRGEQIPEFSSMGRPSRMRGKNESQLMGCLCDRDAVTRSSRSRQPTDPCGRKKKRKRKKRKKLLPS